jgi:hypothetical protein
MLKSGQRVPSGQWHLQLPKRQRLVTSHISWAQVSPQRPHRVSLQMFPQQVWRPPQSLSVLHGPPPLNPVLPPPVVVAAPPSPHRFWGTQIWPPPAETQNAVGSEQVAPFPQLCRQTPCPPLGETHT